MTDSSFSRVGGALCLDFTNTVTWHPDGVMNERWQHPDAFIDWALELGALSPSEMRRFARPRTPSSADRAQLLRAMRIRGVLHELFSAMARNAKPPAHALAATNRFLRAAQRNHALRFSGPGSRYQWDVSGDVGPFPTTLARVAASALSLLTSAPPRIVKLCANPNCGWLFLDESRRQNRRWCDMSECGARHKARAHYARQRNR